MTRNRVWIALVVCFVLSFGTMLFAASPTSGNSDALMDVLQTLQSKGVLTQQEYNQLKERVAADQAKQAQAAPQLQTVAMDNSAMDHGTNIVSAASSGVGFHTSRFDVNFNGEVNGFLVHSRPNSPAISCDLCLIDQGADTTNAIRSGLLPSWLGIKISTQEKGWDVAAYFGIWPAIQNNNLPSVETGLGGTFAGGSPGIDFRQNYATLSHKNFGTLLIGRQLGLFGQEAILNDMTLLGAGSTNGSNQFPGNVTFGRIGVGYLYTDFLPQITYTTPSFKGFQGSIGIMQPYDDPIATLGVSAEQSLVNFTSLDGHTQPMIQGKLTYTAKPVHGIGANFWSNFMTEKETATAPIVGLSSTLAAGDGVRATGVDYGVKLTLKGLTFVGYGYNGWGLGTTALLFDGVGLNQAGDVSTRPSQGWYAQLGYQLHRNFFGFSYGQSNLSPTGSNDANWLATHPGGLGYVLRNNTAYIAQYRFGVTSWDNLVAEYTHATAENAAGQKGNSDSIALGTIVFF